MRCVDLMRSMWKYIGELGYQSLKKIKTKNIYIKYIDIKYRLCRLTVYSHLSHWRCINRQTSTSRL